jgi:hypothetical protein
VTLWQSIDVIEVVDPPRNIEELNESPIGDIAYIRQHNGRRFSWVWLPQWMSVAFGNQRGRVYFVGYHLVTLSDTEDGWVWWEQIGMAAETARLFLAQQPYSPKYIDSESECCIPTMLFTACNRHS